MFFNYNKIYNLYNSRLRESLKSEAILVVEIAKNYDVMKMHEPFSNIPSRFSLISADGKVIYDSDEFQRKDSLDNHLLRSEIQESLQKGEGFSIRRSITQRRNNAYFAMSFVDAGGQKIYLRVSQNYKITRDELNNILLFNIFFFIFLNLLIHLAYKNYLKRYFLLRLDAIKLYLTKRTLSESKEYSLDEDKWLVDFWKVAESWQEENIKNLHELKIEKNLLQSIVTSVELAVVLFDKNLNMVLKNEQLTYLFGLNGKSLAGAIKPLELYNIINQFYINYEKDGETKELINREIYLEEYKKFYLLTIKILENESLLILIKDITPLREFIEVQKKFIGNISHELKTPLTNIKGYLIALEDAPEELKKDFFMTIHNNVNKLENIIQDFLSISKVESSNILNIQEIPLKKLIDDVQITLSSIIHKKNGKIIFEKSREVKETIIGDYDKILIILKNLVENGFIYNKNKNPQVKITIEQNFEDYIFRISDNGIGIDTEKQNKIFERFYRVDEARTSNLAGTGLGLSIVQEIIKKMQGEIKIESILGEGTTFIFKIPKN